MGAFNTLVDRIFTLTGWACMLSHKDKQDAIELKAGKPW